MNYSSLFVSWQTSFGLASVTLLAELILRIVSYCAKGMIKVIQIQFFTYTCLKSFYTHVEWPNCIKIIIKAPFDFIVTLWILCYFKSRQLKSEKANQIKEKYDCTSDLVFIFLGLSCFAYVEFATALHIWSNPNQSNRRSTALLYFPYCECSLHTT